MRFQKEYKKKGLTRISEEVGFGNDSISRGVEKYLNFLDDFLDDLDDYIIDRKMVLNAPGIEKCFLEESDKKGAVLINLLNAQMVIMDN